MENKYEIHRLIIAYLRKDISAAEWTELKQWMEAKESHKLLFEQLMEEKNRQQDLKEYSSFDTATQWLELKEKLNEPRRKNSHLWIYGSMAASLVLLLGIALTLLYRQPEETQPPIAQIIPGGSHAILIREDGQQVVLGNMQDTCHQLILGADTLQIIRGSSIKYDTHTLSKQLEWHTLRIPRGGEFKLVLEDGTEVWLNSETELKYPVHFAASERKVELSGEAYFKVARNPKKPFIVTTPTLETKVLGTSFNISAYPDEGRNHTTLIEGRVEVENRANGQQVLLKPGEQALIQNGELSVQHVDTKLYSLWRMDRFTFASANLGEVIQKLSRWYNVEFFFSNTALRNKQFTGSLPKYSDIKQILNIIEMTTSIEFQIENNTIIIK